MPSAPPPHVTADLATQTLAEHLSLLHLPRPFKSTTYARNPTRRTKNLKNVLGQERERERAARERRRVAREERAAMAVDPGGEAMHVDGDGDTGETRDDEEDDVPTCTSPTPRRAPAHPPTDTSIEAPPSLLPPRHYCDITGLDVRPPAVS